MRLGSMRAHLGLLSAVAVLLGLLLFIVFWLDHPFGNQLGVTSEPFEQSLSVFDSIDRGHDQPKPKAIPRPKSNSTLTPGTSLTVFALGYSNAGPAINR